MAFHRLRRFGIVIGAWVCARLLSSSWEVLNKTTRRRRLQVRTSRFLSRFRIAAPVTYASRVVTIGFADRSISFDFGPLLFLCARGSVVFKAQWYKPEGRGFETRVGEFLICLILSARLGPAFHSASNRNEYQKYKNNNVSGE
jgi:hypothetical protein